MLLDDGPESDLYWVVSVTETGEIWTFANKLVRASKNITLGRSNPTDPPSAATCSGGFDGQKVRPRAGVVEEMTYVQGG